MFFFNEFLKITKITCKQQITFHFKDTIVTFSDT